MWWREQEKRKGLVLGRIFRDEMKGRIWGGVEGSGRGAPVGIMGD